MADILLAKLQSGEEIIAKIKENDDTNYILSDVRLLMVQQTPEGQMGLGMIPWMVGAPDSLINLDKSMVSGMVHGTIPKNIEDAYLQQTSGIQLAGANGMNIG